MSFVALIPARLASTRLPEKALADIGGRPMVVRVAERARLSGARAVHVATDNERIYEAVRAHGFDAVMTRADHASGTERLAEACDLLGLGDEVCVVNVQGDEPLVDPALIDTVAATLQADAALPMATAAHPLIDAAEAFNPNIVKVVLDYRARALYFSRAPIPYARDDYAQSLVSVPAGMPLLRHIGIYGYRAGFLRRYRELSPCAIEQFEALEQLRVLWHGYPIAVATIAQAPEGGVDTPADLARVRQRWLKISTN